mgnify:CR=1 FL=1
MEGLTSNLNLNGPVSPRVMPRVGEWAPTDVPSTRQKKRQRWWAILAAVVALAAVVGFGYFAWRTLMGY